MSAILESLVGLLPTKYQGVAKALVPVALAFVAAVVSALQTGVEWKQALIIGGGAAVGLLIHQTPNREPHAAIEELS